MQRAYTVNKYDKVKRAHSRPHFSEKRTCFEADKYRLASDGLFVLDLIVKPLAESFRHLILNTVPDQFHDVSGAVQDRLAMSTCFEVGLHACAQFGIDLPI